MDDKKKNNKSGIIIKTAVIILIILSVVVIYLVKNNDKNDNEDDDFSKIDESGFFRLVDLGSDSCSGCIQLKPVIKKLKEYYKGRLAVQIVNVSTDKEETEKYYKIQPFQYIPTILLLDKDMNLLWSYTGYMEKDELISIIKEHTGIE